MNIDTDDLSEPTRRAILYEAEKFNHDLTLQFGLLSYHCKDEADYIARAKELIEDLLDCKEKDMDDIFFGNPPTIKDFHTVLNRIKKNVEQLEIK
jgi:hypothetical protein